MNNCIIIINGLHDTKRFYILTGHLLYNPKHKHFILYGCRTGQGVTNEPHVCDILSNKKRQNVGKKLKEDEIGNIIPMLQKIL